MSDIKKLFEKQKGQQVLGNATLNKIGNGVESADYVKANIKEKNRFVPYVNFSSASNFARYGLAEKYYEDSIDYISNEYPYDGSKREAIEWNLTASYLDKYIFENEYPRTNGYVNIGLEYGTVTFGGVTNLDASTKSEYIEFFGNNTTTAANVDLNQKLSLNFDNLRISNTASQGLSNLELNGDTGFGAEFWLKKDGWSSTAESREQVIVDVWNSSSGTPSRGLFRVTAQSASAQLHVTLLSGSVVNNMTLGSSLPLSGNTWNHYALMFKNDSTAIEGKLYLNGVLVDTTASIDAAKGTMSTVTGSMVGYIGATSGYGDGGTSGEVTGAGYGKLSASLDEFRFWKRERSVEQVGRNWFTQVGGGTNTDIKNEATASTKYSYENPVDLGVYYKFNEGIYNTASIDSYDTTVLDYAGRVTNGSWTGYSLGARSTGSAIVESSASLSEFKDPIIYSTHPDVVALRNTKKEEGREYDFQNNANIYHSIPSWIIAEDEDKDRQPLKDLTQIMASYFDTLHIQIESVPEIKNVRYATGSDKPYPFADRLLNSLGLVTSDIFSQATDLEYLASRNDQLKFAEKLNETKNNIYQNIYNNLSFIYKSKGTEKSFRNLIRCFGVGEELVKLNLYGSDITHEIRDNVDFRTIKKRYADFHNSLRFSSTVFQQTSSTNANSRNYVGSSLSASWAGNTYEAEAIFPQKTNFGEANYVQNDFVTASLFGCHTSGTLNAWGTPDEGNFQVASIRPSIYSSDARFRLSGTTGYPFGELTSSVFKDVYNGGKWNFAVTLKPSKYPIAPSVSGSNDETGADTFELGFSGYNYVLDQLVNSFKVTSSVSSTNALMFLSSSKRFFLGAHRQDFTSTVLEQSDAKLSSLRVWYNYLEDQTIKAHARDAENFGSKNPYKSSYIGQYNKTLESPQIIVPEMETLVLNWNFDTVTSSNASGEFVVPDFTSGSTDLTSRWGWLGDIAAYQHLGRGYAFPANATGSISREYVNSAKQQLPETLNSSDMISLIDEDKNQIFSRDSRPIDYAFAFEKSMNSIISEQMINYFGTIVAFNNLIGDPVNRYRQDYKDMEKLRALYFERVENTPDFEKFVEFFKWIDSAVGLMLIQLAPASAQVSENLRNVIESHVLERNKYWSKFPTLDAKPTVPEAGLRGINELLYSWERGHAPFAEESVQSACIQWENSVNLRITDYPGAWNAGCGGVYKSAGGNTWNSWANGKGIGVHNSVTFLSAFGTTTTNSAKVGLHTSEGSAGDEPAFAFWFDANSANAVIIHENGSDPTGGSTWTLNTTDYWRIQRSGDGTIEYQRSTDGGANFSTVYTSAIKNSSTLYPVIAVQRVPSLAAGITSATAEIYESINCLWWHDRAEENLSLRGNSTVDSQRNTFKLANDFRSGSGPTLAVSRDSVSTTTTYQGSAYALRNFTQPYRFAVQDMPTFGGGSNFPKGKKLDYAHTELKANPINTSTIQLRITASSTNNEKNCTDIINPSAKERIEAAFVSNQSTDNFLSSLNYDGGKSSIFAPFSLFSSSISPSYLSDFKKHVELNNYHDDSYGDDHEVPAQGPFTNAHVGGWQYRHQNLNSGATDTSFTRGEAWELDVNSSEYIQIQAQFTSSLPKATMLRNTLAKRPLNIANIKWGTSSAVAGNYQHDYQMIQTSGRRINNRFFVKNEGFEPTSSDTGIFEGAIDYALPDYDATGSNQFIFVERFNAPGGPEVSSRGCMDVNAEEFSVYNQLNYRNSLVRASLDKWQTQHCGQFGITPTGSVGDGTTPKMHRVRQEAYSDVIAAYHKTNRNPFINATGVKDIPKFVWWTNFNSCSASPYQYNNVTLTKDADAGTNSNQGFAQSNKRMGLYGYVEFENNPTNEEARVTVGFWPLSSNVYADGAFYIVLEPRRSGQGDILVVDYGTTTTFSGPGTDPAYASGERFRVVRAGDSVHYQRNNVSGSWVTFHEAAIAPRDTTFNVIAHLWHDGNFGYDRSSVKDVEISTGRYDNWFVQHPIPQSALQYKWIADSYDVQKAQPFGYVSNFSVPSGSNSTTASAVQFIASSSWGPDWTAAGTPVSFTQFWFQNGWSPASRYRYTIDPATNLLSAPEYWTANFGQSINGFFNNINGPYGYPSWKQIRTGENPVPRYQRKNNILSVMSLPRLTTLANGSGSGQGATFYNKRTEAYKQFVEPPVVFKYKALDTLVTQEDETNLKMRSSYGNNKGMFSQAPIKTLIEVGNIEAPNSGSIADYLNLPEDNSNVQIYDLMKSDEDVWSRVPGLFYNEVVYPRANNTGLARTRGRINYAEVASGSFYPSIDTFSASLSDGINGIDRGPLLRRTFWRNDPIYRNRRSVEYLTTGLTPIIATTLPNSQGFKDGFATSVNSWGNTPIVFGSIEGDTSTIAGSANTASLSSSNVFDAPASLADYPDTGELNSANYQTIAGYVGSQTDSVSTNVLVSQSIWFPTASCYFYHRQMFGNPGRLGLTSQGQMRWRVSELSGKTPWFDSYEDYANDIRGQAKAFTVIPEFRISQQMDYYADGRFKKENNQFLTLDGASITSSAQEVTGGFTEEFFNEYSNTDFQKYFGKFSTDHTVTNITLKCNGVKKLLPYHGFYPSHRTLQIATLFSQSIAPHIGGIYWASGSQIGNPKAESSGALAVQSLLQPYYAPGIMYNTIKAGIACDWAAYTGSGDWMTSATTINGYLHSASNYRIPFESILDPLGDVGIPVSASGYAGKLNLLYPSYGVNSLAGLGGVPREPYMDITPNARINAQSGKSYGLYQASISNFMAEIPNFFLQGNKLSTIVSKTAGAASGFVAGSTYYMDVTLHSPIDLVMVQDHFNGYRGFAGSSGYYPDNDPLVSGTTARSFNGRYFGPPVQAGRSTSANPWGPGARDMSDPAYAPYTPPYFYGKSHATIAYTADGEDEGGNFNYKKLQEKAVISYKNPIMDNMFDILGGGGPSYAPALSSSMPLSSSVNLFGLFQEKETTLDEFGNLETVTDKPDSKRTKWVISPRMETPVLNFENQPEEWGFGRGMWSGYGNIPTGNTNITLGIEETFKAPNTDPLTGSLIEKCFTSTTSTPIGKIATQKKISEAIVAIPFTQNFIQRGSIFRPSTTSIMGKRFFEINQSKFDYYRDWYRKNKAADTQTSPPLPSVSIQKMLTLMDQYVIPPELDFLTYATGNEKVNPFVMYLFEFNHTLSDVDLSDIWQGVMPEISRVAEQSDPNVDDNIFTHPTGENEFFHGKQLPDDVRWMVFKVKKKANWDYYSVTADTTDDAKFNYQFSVGDEKIPYSYNWPYDFCSLVELAQLEAGDTFVKKGGTPRTQQQVERNVNPVESEAAAGNLQTREQTQGQGTATSPTTTGGNTGRRNPGPGESF